MPIPRPSRWVSDHPACAAAAREAVEAVRREKDREIERLKAALGRLAMRSFAHDGSLCWCDGPVLDPMTHDHDPDCLQAREAMGYES